MRELGQFSGGAGFCTRPTDGLLVLQRNRGHHARLVAVCRCSVAFAHGVLYKAGIAGPEDALATVLEADLELA